jgi:excisionase family DNA binding protein
VSGNKAKTRKRRAQHHRLIYGSIEELAADIGLSRQATYAGLRHGIIPHIRIGKRFVVPRAAMAEWLRTAGNQAVANTVQ